MQFSQPIGRIQLPLFHDAIVATPLHDLLEPEAPWKRKARPSANSHCGAAHSIAATCWPRC